AAASPLLVELMSVCPKCATENEDVDFCVNCGTYLRWDPTRIQPAVTAPPAPAEPPPAAEPPAAPPPPPAAPPAEAAGAGSAAAPPAPPAPPPPPPAPEPPLARAEVVPPVVDTPAAPMRTMDMPVIRTGEPLPPGVAGVPSLLTPEAVQITLTYPELPGSVQ